ncbi:MAG: OmpH family outer membrane protein, partial [Deltaproteobacteria bacterium]|nr:OmpH family outer membrane protein [Deltaproteobacteria bacterium]
MRQEKIAFWFVVTLVLAVAAPSWAVDIAKIGVVDFQKVLSVSNAGKQAQAEINKQGKAMEEDLKKKGSEIEEIKKRLERETLVMSKENREEKEREFRIKLNDFKMLKQKYAGDFKRMEKRLVNRIQKAIFELVEEMGKKEGFLLIVEKREGGVLYYPSTIDITDRLIQNYNELFIQKRSGETA